MAISNLKKGDITIAINVPSDEMPAQRTWHPRWIFQYKRFLITTSMDLKTFGYPFAVDHEFPRIFGVPGFAVAFNQGQRIIRG
jgi:hypothetical protein